MARLMSVIIVLGVAASGLQAAARAPIPENVQRVLAARCLDCHTGDDAEAEVRLDGQAIDWEIPAEVDLWRRVVEVVEDRHMPPPDVEPATPAERDTLVAFLDPPLVAHTSFGGTPPRRLSRPEYETTIRRLLNLPSFHLPVGFPGDTERHGFDNIAEGIVLSPAHLEAYAAVAREVAD